MPLRAAGDGWGVRLFGRGYVSFDASYVRESGAIADVVEDVAAGLTAGDVESSQGVRCHLFGRVVGSELTDEVVGAEPCQPMRGVCLG